MPWELKELRVSTRPWQRAAYVLRLVNEFLFQLSHLKSCSQQQDMVVHEHCQMHISKGIDHLLSLWFPNTQCYYRNTLYIQERIGQCPFLSLENKAGQTKLHLGILSAYLLILGVRLCSAKWTSKLIYVITEYMVLFMMRFSQKTQKVFDKESHFSLEHKNRQQTRE